LQPHYSRQHAAVHCSLIESPACCRYQTVCCSLTIVTSMLQVPNSMLQPHYSHQHAAGTKQCVAASL